MKYLKIILVALLFSIPITAQELIMIYSGDGTTGGTASADTIPSQFTFPDVTDAALSSYNQAYIVVAGCDSARFYPASGDSLKLGALGTYDVSPIWADLGDSVYTGLVASGTNETATHSIIYSSNGTPYDTFSVTTVAGGGDTLGVNQILNGDMELAFTGNNEWESKFGATVTRSTGEQVHGGTYSCKVVTAGGGTGTGNVYEVSAIEDSTYWVEGWIYVVSGAANVLVESGSPSVEITAKDTWTYFKFSRTFTATEGMYVIAKEYGGGGNTTFYLDDVTVKRLLP